MPTAGIERAVGRSVARNLAVVARSSVVEKVSGTFSTSTGGRRFCAEEKVPDTLSKPDASAANYFCRFTGTLTASGSGESKASEMFSPVPSTRAVSSSVSVSESN